jgi:hypothetical protein
MKKTETENKSEEGFYKEIELVPQVSKQEAKFNDLVKHLNDGEKYVMKAGVSKNTLYTLIRKLSEKANLSVVYGVSKTGQFVIYNTVIPVE